MKCDVITIFPEIFHAYLSEGILKRALQGGIIELNVHNLRGYTDDRHRTVDDYPYGGGSGMVMKPEPFFSAVETVCPDRAKRRVLVMTPAGKQFSQDMAYELSKEQRRILLLCGRYEAIDERVSTGLADDEVSIGDYILTGGELPALVIIDSVARLVPGVLGDNHSVEEESFSWGILDYPHFTRPPEYRSMLVPQTLLSGNHQEITRWRRKEALRKTLRARPELLDRSSLSDDDLNILKEIKEEQE